MVGDAPSSLRLMLPEIYLKSENADDRQERIARSMAGFLKEKNYREFKNAFFYVERTQPDGRVRRGLLGALDLETYDFRHDARSLVRATEETVLDRLPPRVKIRSKAPIELPHILILSNDPLRRMIYPLSEKKDSFEKVYDFDLMLGGGHIAAWCLDEESVFGVLSVERQMAKECGSEPIFAVGDGNHSVATAKVCYEKLKSEIGVDKAKNHPSRYALVEVVNIHDPALDFESIYRVIFDCDPLSLVSDLKKAFSSTGSNAAFTVVYGEKEEQIPIFLEKGELVISKLQPFLDRWLKEHPASGIDYIHEIGNTISLARKPRSVGIIYDCIRKKDLFPAVGAFGSLPCKTFSMGVSRDKRYYLEARRILPE